MTQLPLAQPGPRSRYTAHTRSPRTFAAALAINGGVFALILALPGVQKVLPIPDPGLSIWEVPIEKDPPPIEKTVEHKQPVTSQRAVETPREDPLPFVQPTETFPPVRVVQGTEAVIPPVIETPARPPVHVPVFNGATRDPRFADAFHPAYPPALQRLGLEGSVTVRVTIDEKGRVIACELVKATDKAFFEETREQALKRWRFRPATSDGVPVQSQQTLTVNFQLEA